MGKSRKQKLKNQDFKKKKLKVGKIGNKPSNATDTSFSAKSISIKSQHIQHDSDVSKRLPLLKHHNNTVRKETLQIFQKSLPNLINSTLMTPLVSQTIPMICDQSKSVRSMLMELFEEIGKQNTQILRLHCRMIVLYINMGMTHINTAIQADSSKFLRIFLKYCGNEICRQAWIKVIDGLFTLLGWSSKGKNQGAGVAQTRKKDAVTINGHILTMQDLIRCGCMDDNTDEEQEDDTKEDDTKEEEDASGEADVQTQYMLPNHSQPYQYLKLFTKELNNPGSTSTTTASRDTAEMSTQDKETRIQILREQYLATIRKQTDLYIKEGGECGKSANNLKQLLLTIYP